jgi:hypothetical protein
MAARILDHSCHTPDQKDAWRIVTRGTQPSVADFGGIVEDLVYQPAPAAAVFTRNG